MPRASSMMNEAMYSCAAASPAAITLGRIELAPATSTGYLMPPAVPDPHRRVALFGLYAKGDAMAALVGQWAATSTDDARKALIDQIQVQLYANPHRR